MPVRGKAGATRAPPRNCEGIAMPKQRTHTQDELNTYALGFLARVQGSWTDEAISDWRAELTRLGFAPAASEISIALAHAHERFYEGPGHLLVCMGRPCHVRQKFDASDAAMRQGLDASLLLSTTECQGPCKQAPVATLRIGQRSMMFAQFAQTADWQAVRSFAQRAAAAGTLLVEQGSAEAFAFDPVHDHEHGSVVLQPLRFLLGRFQGEGEETTRPMSFQKEMVGSLEAGGRCLALRMGVTYPLANGQKDTHNAFVTIGVNPDTEAIEARAYTDGGAIHEFQLQMEGDAVVFAERPPVHNDQAQRARKILRPTPDGFEERVEVDYGSGQYEMHSVLAMQRVTPSASL